MKLPYKKSTRFGLTFFLLCVIIGCSLLSCDKSEDLANPGKGNNNPNDSYYIQYNISAPGPTVDLAIGRPPLLMGLIQIVDFKSGLGIRPTVLYKRVFLAGFK